MRVRVARRVSGLAGLALVATTLPTASASAAETFAIEAVRAVGDGWQRQIELHVTGVRSPVSFRSELTQGSSTSTPYATIDDFSLVSGTLADGIWRSGTAVTLRKGLSRLDTTATAAGNEVGANLISVLYRPQTLIAEFGVKTEPVDSRHRKVTYQGRVVYKGPDGGYLPPAGKVTLNVSGFDQPAVALDENGRYDASIVLPHGGQAWVRFAGTDFLPSTSFVEYVPGAPLHRTEFTEVSAAPDPVGKGARVTVSGRVEPSPTAAQPIVLEFCPDGAGTWTRVGQGNSDGGGFVKVSAVASRDGEWRLTYAGDFTEGATDFFSSSQSAPQHVDVRYRTAVAAFNAGPEPVRKGKTLTVSGVLKRSVDGKALKAWAGRPVYVYYRATGSKTWTYAGSAKTDRYGKFRKGFKAGRDATWKTVYKGDADHLPADSPTDYVDVR